MANTETKVPRRGRFLESFLNNEDIQNILKYVAKHPELDAQLRDGYFNIYYKGGNILRVEQRVRNAYELYLDKYYFYTGKVPKTYIEEWLKDKPRENRPKNYPKSKKEAEELVRSAKKEHEEAMSLIKKEKRYDDFFKKVKTAIDKWLNLHKRAEREKQHYISCSNRKFSSQNNLVVIDLEFAVSKNKPYNSAKKMPKFDIIAVNEKGQIYCIELKDNLNADNDNSPQNIKGHERDFNKTVRDAIDFRLEMDELLKRKQQLELLPENINIDTNICPTFAIAFSGKQEEKDRFNKKYNGKYQIIEINVDNNKYFLNLVK